MSLEDLEYQTLLWFGVDICPHLLGGTVLTTTFAVVNLIFDKKILHLDILGLL